jgi:thiol-disulfide isomerase/thioredoxin
MNWKMILLALVVVVLVAVGGFIAYKTTKQGFQNPNTNTFTMYYANWCPHCKSAKGEFSSLIKNGQMNVGNSSVSFRMVEQGEDKSGEMKAKNVKGFPTFLLETTDGKTIEYNGPRSTDAYLGFLNSSLGSGV